MNVTVFRWFTELYRGQNYVPGLKKNTGRPLSDFVEENLSVL